MAVHAVACVGPLPFRPLAVVEAEVRSYILPASSLCQLPVGGLSGIWDKFCSFSRLKPLCFLPYKSLCQAALVPLCGLPHVERVDIGRLDKRTDFHTGLNPGFTGVIAGAL